MLARVLMMGIAAVLMALISAAAHAQMRLGTPDVIETIVERTGSTERGCGFRADFAFPDHTLRVEILAVRAADGVDFAIQAFSPTSVTPPLRDLWLKTPTYFTVGMFAAGRINSKGFPETKGRMAAPDAAILLNELEAGGTEISLVFEGTLPFSRVPVALPRPLPQPVLDRFRACRQAALP